MRFPVPDPRIARVLIVLAIAQIIAWGTLSLLAIVGRTIAADLHMDIAAVFAGSSLLYVVMGLCAPWLSGPFTRFGARRVMIAGAALAGPGFILLALAQNPLSYFAAWIVLGIAGSASLTTSAQIMLNEIAGKGAKRAIAALTLVTGLSSSIFWPSTAHLVDLVGWRATSLVFAALLALVCLPLYAFGLPRAVHAATEPGTAAPPITPLKRDATFYLVAAAISCNAFVTFGFAAILIELLKAEGLPPTQAIAFGSALGVLGAFARGVDFIGGGRWDGIATALFAGAALPVAFLVLIAGNGQYWAVATFILVYGLGAGALAVTRATIPLVFYDKAAYAQAASTIALPLNLVSAASPPLMVALLTGFGSRSVLALAVVCSCAALVILLLLGRRRPDLQLAPAQATP